jgi:hypothetical protein
MTNAKTGSWRGGVGWPALLLVLAVAGVLAGTAGAGTAYWLLSRYTLHLPVQAQRLQVQLPADLPVEVEILPQAAADAPLQAIPVRIDERFRTLVRVDTQVPVRMTVPFRGEVPVDITLPLKTRVKTRVLGIEMELPVEGRIPLQFNLPVDLSIPIDQTLPMRFDLPVTTRINQTVNVQVPTQQAARIRLREARLDVTVNDSEIAVPLAWLWLVGPGRDGEPAPQLGPLRTPPPRP